MRKRILAVVGAAALAGGGWTVMKPEPLYSSASCRSTEGHTCDYVCECTSTAPDGGCYTFRCTSYYRW